MKYQMLLVALSAWKKLEAKTKRKIYVFLGIFSVLSLALAVFAISLIIKASGFLIDKSIEIGNTALQNAPAVVQTNIPPLPTISQINQTQLLSCAERLQGLLSFEPWLHVPLSKTFDSVWSACFGTAAVSTTPAAPTAGDFQKGNNQSE